jgi:hypothetical protein
LRGGVVLGLADREFQGVHKSEARLQSKIQNPKSKHGKVRIRTRQRHAFELLRHFLRQPVVALVEQQLRVLTRFGFCEQESLCVVASRGSAARRAGLLSRLPPKVTSLHRPDVFNRFYFSQLFQRKATRIPFS